jgi:hypothetical protein
MTKRSCLFLLVLLYAAPYVHAAPATTEPAKTDASKKVEQAEVGALVPFETHDGYFVSNRFEPDAAASFVVLRDQKAFDEVFGVARVMNDKSRRLPADAFEAKLVAAAVLRGKALVTYKPESVKVAAGVLTIRYSTTSQPSDSATFACPLILSIPKGNYAAVVFIQDGKAVKTVELPDGRGTTHPG